MKTPKKTLFVICILLAGCSQNESVSEDGQAAIIGEVKSLLDQYPGAVKGKDLNWFSNFWANDKDFVFAFDGQLQTDYDTWFKAYYADGLAGLKDVLKFEWSNGHGAVLGDNVVSYATNFDWAIITVSGDTVRSKGSALYVFRRTSEGSWRVVNSGGTHTYY